VVIVGARIKESVQHFVERQPDGKRGARYVDFDAGTCAQNIYLTVAAEDLEAVVVMGFDDDRMKAALCLPSDIVPIALFCIGQP
jgi:nitroreductase